LLSDGISFGDKKLILREATAQAAQVSLDYGLLIETVLDFLIVGFTIFLVVKFINRLRVKADDVQDVSVPTPADVELLSKIKDLLEEQNKVLSKK
jgi:large conductance mechanosensitive channel